MKAVETKLLKLNSNLFHSIYYYNKKCALYTIAKKYLFINSFFFFFTDLFIYLFSF